jgi:hypothetical protein
VDIISFAKKVMAKPVSMIKVTSKCPTIPNNDGGTNDTNECRSFYFYPEKKNSLTISKVEFPVLILDTDSLKLVKSISCFKSYPAKDMIAKTGRFQTDCRYIKQQLKTLFHAEGADNGSYKDEYYETTVTKWLYDSFNIILDITTYFKRGNQDKFSVISIYLLRK